MNPPTGTKERKMRRRFLWVLGATALVLGAAGLLAHFALAGPKVQVGRPCAEPNRPALAEVDHQPYDDLLRKYVDDHGLVAYGRWKATTGDAQALDEYLARLGCVDLRKPAPRAAQLAYWINVYNALTIKGIVREYPTNSIRNHTSRLGGYHIWKDLLLWVDGSHYSLEAIEHQVLRPLGEPRIHFAIVCASKGCPPLANRAYTAADLDQQLTANARRFFAQPENFRADARSRTVYVSQLLKWYGTDFAVTPAEQLRVLRPYLPSPESLAWIDSSSPTVRSLDYDWGLNDQHPLSR
jgi:hypothetical protein